MSKITFGGGCISPAIAAHLKKTFVQSSKKTNATKTQIGGGCVSPLVSVHLAKGKQFGGGCISPLVAAHLAKRNTAKK